MNKKNFAKKCNDGNEYNIKNGINVVPFIFYIKWKVKRLEAYFILEIIYEYYSLYLLKSKFPEFEFF